MFGNSAEYKLLKLFVFIGSLSLMQLLYFLGYQNQLSTKLWYYTFLSSLCFLSLHQTFSSSHFQNELSIVYSDFTIWHTVITWEYHTFRMKICAWFDHSLLFTNFDQKLASFFSIQRIYSSFGSWAFQGFFSYIIRFLVSWFLIQYAMMLSVIYVLQHFIAMESPILHTISVHQTF